MAIYKCRKCGWSTTDESKLTLVKGCCGRNKYRCMNCGYPEVSGPAQKAATIRTTTGHGGRIVRKPS